MKKNLTTVYDHKYLLEASKVTKKIKQRSYKLLGNIKNKKVLDFCPQTGDSLLCFNVFLSYFALLQKRDASKIMQSEHGRKKFCSQVHVGIDRINVATSSPLFSGLDFLLRIGNVEHLQVFPQCLSQIRTLTHLRV